MDASPLVCADCGSSFEFSDEERSRFTARGFAQPKRCKGCRAAKRRRQRTRETQARVHAHGSDAVVSMMRTDAPAAKRARPRAPLRPATCTICGAGTEVPFEPDGVRPVYCLPCLKQRTR